MPDDDREDPKPESEAPPLNASAVDLVKAEGLPPEAVKVIAPILPRSAEGLSSRLQAEKRRPNDTTRITATRDDKKRFLKAGRNFNIRERT